MQVCFLMSAVNHVRFRKRVEALKENGVNPVTLGYERDNVYPGKPIPGEFVSLGAISHRNYLKRFLPFVSAIKSIRKTAKNSNAVYAFGLDMLLLGWLATIGTKRRLVYEVGDIREVFFGTGIKSRVFRGLERFLLGRTDLLVVTSQAFYTQYFQGVQNTKVPCQVIENKLTDYTKTAATEIEKTRTENLKIGYFGVLRCPRSWEILRQVATDDSQVYVRGIPRDLETFHQDVQSNSNLTYGGPYVVPDDLPQLYTPVDMVWACYPYQGKKTGNWKWARTIRFYESCYYKKPMIAQAGTEDGKVIEELQIGMTVDLSDVKNAVEQVRNITREQLEQWQNNINQIPEDIYLITHEHLKLYQNLKNLR